MAGLADLNRQKIIENDKTSSVPVNRSDLEPYEPSAARGVAGLALAGAGAVALRNPIGRANKKNRRNQITQGSRFTDHGTS